MYLVFVCMPGESYRRRFSSLLLHLCYGARVLARESSTMPTVGQLQAGFDTIESSQKVTVVSAKSALRTNVPVTSLAAVSSVLSLKRCQC